MIPGGWLGILAAGVILGALGQGARAIVGIKKLNDYIDDTDSASVAFDGIRLLISFGIGAVAGAAAAIMILPETGEITKEQLLGIAAAGYAGSDFIEGFISRISGSQTSAAESSPLPSTGDSADGAVG